MEAVADVNQFKYERVLPALSLLSGFSGYPIIASYGRRFFYQHQPQWVAAYQKGLQQAFPDHPEEILRRWTSKHFSMMATEELDAFQLSCMTPENYQQWITFKHIPPCFYADDHVGKILILGHYSRFLLLSALGLAGIPCHFFTTGVKNQSALSDIQRSYLIRKGNWMSEKIRGQWITKENNYRDRLRQVLTAGQAVWIVVDVPIELSKVGAIYPFMGGGIRVSKGNERLAEETGARLYYARFQQSSLHAECEIIPLPKLPSQAMQQAFVYLEQDILTAPWLWWHWNVWQSLWSPIR